MVEIEAEDIELILNQLNSKEKYPEVIIHGGCGDGNVLNRCYEYNICYNPSYPVRYIGFDTDELKLDTARKLFEFRKYSRFHKGNVERYHEEITSFDLKSILGESNSEVYMLHIITPKVNMPFEYWEGIFSHCCQFGATSSIIVTSAQVSSATMGTLTIRFGFTAFTYGNSLCCFKGDTKGILNKRVSHECQETKTSTRDYSAFTLLEEIWSKEPIYQKKMSKEACVRISDNILDELASTFPSNTFRYYSDKTAHDQFQQLALYHVLYLFKQLDFEKFLRNPKSVSQLILLSEINPSYHNLLECLMEWLETFGFVSSDFNKNYKLQAMLPNLEKILSTIESCSDTIYRNYCSLEPKLKLVNRCGYGLPGILLGSKRDTLRCLYPEGDEAHDSSVDKVLTLELNKANEILQQILANFMVEDEVPIRMLQIGADMRNDCSTSFYIREACKKLKYNVDLTLTAISSRFLEKSDNETKFKLLNIESEPKSQGFAPQSWDVAIVSNIHFDLSNVSQVFGNIRQLLKPNGLLFILEMTSLSLEFDITFGLLDCWWKGQSNNNRRMLTSEKWRQVINETTLFNVQQIIGYPSSVIVAKAIGSIHEVGPTKQLTSGSPWMLIQIGASVVNSIDMLNSFDGHSVFPVNISANNDQIPAQLFGVIILISDTSNNYSEITSWSKSLQNLLKSKELETKKLVFVRTNPSPFQVAIQQSLLLDLNQNLPEQRYVVHTLIISGEETQSAAPFDLETALEEVCWNSQGSEILLDFKEGCKQVATVVAKDFISTSSSINNNETTKMHGGVVPDLTFILYVSTSAVREVWEYLNWFWNSSVIDGGKKVYIFTGVAANERDQLSKLLLNSSKPQQFRLYSNEDLLDMAKLTGTIRTAVLGGIYSIIPRGQNQNTTMDKAFEISKSLWNLHKVGKKPITQNVLILPINGSAGYEAKNGDDIVLQFCKSLSRLRLNSGLNSTCIFGQKSIFSSLASDNAISSLVKLKGVHQLQFDTHSNEQIKGNNVSVQLEDIISDAIFELTGFVCPADLKKTFQELGFNSIFKVQLHDRLETLLNREINFLHFVGNINSMEQLTSYLNSTVASHGSVNSRRRNSSWMSFGEDIAIIGMSCRIGKAKTPDEFMEILSQGENTFSEIPKLRFDWTKYEEVGTKYGSFIPNEAIEGFDCHFFEISPAEATLIDPQQRLLLELTWEALENAGIPPASIIGTNAAVFLGISSHDYEETIALPKAVGSYYATSNLASVASGRLAYVLGIKGPSVSVNTASSSSLAAVHLAVRSLKEKTCSMAIASGVQLIISPTTYMNYCRAKMLTKENGCKPFDENADGILRGEGGAVLILKRLSDAILDGDTVLALIKGSMINQDGGGTGGGLTVPSREAQEELIKDALESCSMLPDDVDYIECHSSGTPLGDPIELNALHEVFNQAQQRRNPLMVGSVKANIGHLEGASGIAGLLKLVLCLRHQMIPRQINFGTLHHKIKHPSTFLIPASKNTPWKALNGKHRIGGVSSFSLSGTNAHVIVEETPKYISRKETKQTGPPYLLTISAKTQPAFEELILNYENKLRSVLQHKKEITAATASEGNFVLEDDESTYLMNMAYTSNVGRTHFKSYRTAILAQNIYGLYCELESISKHAVQPRALDRKPQMICFLIPGEGSEYLGMGKELYKKHSTFAILLDEYSEIIEHLTGKSLISDIFFSEEPNELMDDIRYRHLALFSIAHALAILWIRLGVQPDYILGHALGEYVAAALAGVFTVEDALRLLITRAELTQKFIKKDPNVGVLLVGADVTTIKKLAETTGCLEDIDICYINSHEQTLIFGKTHHLKQLRLAAAADVPTSFLTNMPYVFHSRNVYPLLAKYKEILKNVRFGASKFKIISTTTGELLNDNEIATSDYWIRHSTEPVRFLQAIQTLTKLRSSSSNGGERQGISCIEIGPEQVLCNLGQSILSHEHLAESHNIDWVYSIRQGETNWTSLLKAMSKLYMSGVNLNFNELYNNEKKYKVSIPMYPFQHSTKCWAQRSFDGFTKQLKVPILGLPLVGFEKCSTQTKVIYEQCLQPDGIWEYLVDHAFLGQIIFPGAAFIELALQAGELYLQKQNGFKADIQLVDVGIEIPLILTNDKTSILQTVLQVQGSVADDHNNDEIFTCQPDTTFEIFSVNNDNEFISHARGTLTFNPNTSVNSGELSFSELFDSIKDNSVETDPSTYYNYYKDRDDGVEYGDCFERITRLWISDEFALSEITLPATIVPTLKEYTCHPIVLDNAFQTLFAILICNQSQRYKINSSRYVVAGVSKFILVKPKKGQERRYSSIDNDFNFDDDDEVIHDEETQTKYYAYAKFIKKPNAVDQVNGDIHIFDQNGHCLFLIQGFCALVKTTPSGLNLHQEACPVDLNYAENHLVNPDDVFYIEKWVPCNSAGAEENLTHSTTEEEDPVTSINEIVINEIKAEKLLKSIGPVSQVEENCLFERIAFLYILQALHELQLEQFMFRGRQATVEEFCKQAAVVDKQIRLMKHMFRKLELNSYAIEIKPGSGVWKLCSALPNLQEISKQIQREKDTLGKRLGSNQRAQLDLCITTGELLSGILQGKVNALELLFPYDEIPGASSAAKVYNESVGLKQANSILKKTMQAIVKNQREKLKLLEIGAGTGSATRPALSALTGKGVPFEYTYTDISAAFFLRFREEYDGDLKPLIFKVLNVENDPITQGYESHSYDIIIASNVLHATVNIMDTLVNVRQLLKTNGLLLLVEVTQPSLALDITFGLLDGWWRFYEQDPNRKYYPLMPCKTWKQLLEKHKLFEKCQYIENEESNIIAMASEPSSISTPAIIPSVLPTSGESPYLIIAEIGSPLAESLKETFKSVRASVLSIELEKNEILSCKVLDVVLKGVSSLQAVIFMVGSTSCNARKLKAPTQLTEEEVQLFCRQTCEALLVTLQFVVRRNIKIQNRFAVVTRNGTIPPLPGTSGQQSYVLPFQALLWGGMKTANREHPELKCACIELATGNSNAEADLNILIKELCTPYDELQVAYSQTRHVLRVTSCQKQLEELETTKFQINTSGSYLITGGLGGIGLQIAKWLVDHGVIHIWLLGRSEPSEEALKFIIKLRDVGANVRVARCDVGKRDQLAKIITKIQPALIGVFHAAGSLADSSLLNQSWATISHTFQAKVFGAWNIHALTFNQPLEHFVICSSLASFIGTRGQYNHTAANMFLDSLIHHRVQQGLPGLSINWGAWSSIGSAWGRNLAPGIRSFSPEHGLEYMTKAILSKAPQICISLMDWREYWEAQSNSDKWSIEISRRLPQRQLSKHESTEEEEERPPHVQVTRRRSIQFNINGKTLTYDVGLPKADTVERRNSKKNEDSAQSDEERIEKLTRSIKGVIAKITGFSPDTISETAIFQQLGLDSLMIVDMRNRLQNVIKLSIPMTTIFDCPSVELLAKALLTSVKEKSASLVTSAVSSVGATVFDNLEAKSQLTPTQLLLQSAEHTKANKRPSIPKVEIQIQSPIMEDPYPLTTQPQEPMLINENDIAVIGMACKFGNTQSVDAFWELLTEGKSCIEEFPSWRSNLKGFSQSGDINNLKDNIFSGSFLQDIDKFDNEFFDIHEKDAKLLDPQQRLLLEITWEALEQANIIPGGLLETNTGIFIGISSTDYGMLLERNGISKTTLENQPLSYLVGNIGSTASGRIAHFLGAQGPCMSIDTACSSSLVALHLAVQSLRSKECNLSIVGGANVILTQEKYLHYAKSNMLSQDGLCKSFDEHALGFVRGEGAGIVILKRLADAVNESDNIIGIIKGTSVTQCGLGSGLGVPNGPGQVKMINQALENAKIGSAEIDYVECHATGSLMADAIEVNALLSSSAYGNERNTTNPLLIGAVKANIGHLEAASGMAGLIKVLLGIQAKLIPPQIHFKQLNPNIKDPQLLKIPSNRKGQSWPSGEKMLAAVTSMGYSGTNSHVIIEGNTSRYYKVKDNPNPHQGKIAEKYNRQHNDSNSPAFLFTLSAKSTESLEKLFQAYLDKNWDEATPGNVAFTSNIARSHFKFRCAILANSFDDLRTKLKMGKESCASLSPVVVAEIKQRKIGFIFSGASKQLKFSLHLGFQFYKYSLFFATIIDKCAKIVQGQLANGNISLFDILFGRHSSNNSGEEHFASASRKRNELLYGDVAAFVLQYAIASYFIHLGVIPSHICGLGFVGEYVALVISKALTIEQALQLIISHGKYCNELRSGKKSVSFGNVQTGDSFHSVLAKQQYINSYDQLLNSIILNNLNIPLIDMESGRLITKIDMTEWKERNRVDNINNSPAASNLIESIPKLIGAFQSYGCPQLINFGLTGKAIAPNDHLLIDFGKQFIESKQSNDEWKEFLSTIAQLYVEGWNLNFGELYSTSLYTFEKVQIPLYQFNKKVLWFNEQ